MAQKEQPQYVVMAKPTTIFIMPESGIEIRNSDTGVTLCIRASHEGGFVVTKTAENGPDDMQVLVALPNKFYIL